MASGTQKITPDYKRWLENLNKRDPQFNTKIIGGLFITFSLFAAHAIATMAVTGDLNIHSYALLYVGVPSALLFTLGLYIAGKANGYKGTAYVTKSLCLAILFGALSLGASHCLNDPTTTLILGLGSLSFLAFAFSKLGADALKIRLNNKN